MKETLEHREITTGGIAQSNQFTILANGKAFKTLIDGLYSDKIRAVVRELWTNAFDSHCEAGKADVPFDCKLPTAFDPQFRVRDYGVSLTDDDVMHLYTIVFQSTKGDTNTQVGKLGLGSKSPFAYTDSFTVVAYLDGEKRTYSAFIGEDGVPMIARFATTQSDEPNGLEISFPVQADDISEFLRAARTTILGFDVKPNLSGIDRDLEDKRVVALEGAGWKLFTSGTGETRTAQAKQGCVLYPIDYKAIPDLTRSQRELCNSSMQFDFPIGSLEIAASRESLGYDSQTIENIREQLARAEEEILSQFNVSIEKARTLWEARCIYSKMVSDNAIPSTIRELMKNSNGKTLNWNGKALTTSIQHSNYSRKDRLPNKVLNGFSVSSYGSYELNKKTLRWSPISNWSISYRDATVIVKDDMTTRAVPTRILHMARSAASAGNKIDCVIWVKVKNDRDFKRLMRWIGHPPVVNARDLEKPKVLRSPAPKATEVPIKKWCTKGYERWITTDRGVEEGGYYVDLYREYTVMQACEGVTPRREFGEYHAARVFELSKELGILPDNIQIYGIPATHKRVPHNNEGWINIFDIIHDWLDKNIHQKDFDIKERLNHIEQLDLLNVFIGVFEDERLEISSQTSPAAEFIDLMNEYRATDIIRTNKIHDLAAQVYRPISVPTPDVSKIDDLVTMIEDHYPFLLTFAEHSVSITYTLAKEIVWYIDQIDSRNQPTATEVAA